MQGIKSLIKEEVNVHLQGINELKKEFEESKRELNWSSGVKKLDRKNDSKD